MELDQFIKDKEYGSVLAAPKLTPSMLWTLYCAVPLEQRATRPNSIADQFEIDFAFLSRVNMLEPSLLPELLDSYKRTASFNIKPETRAKLMERGIL